MRETRSSGSVRGASGDARPYRERVLPVPASSGGGRLTERTPAVQRRRRERVKVPHSSHLAAATGVLSTGWEANVERSRGRGSASCFWLLGQAVCNHLPPVGKLCWRAPKPAQPWQDVRTAGKFGPERMQTAGRVVAHLGETDAAGTAILDLDRTDDDDLALVTASATTSHRTMLYCGRAISVSSISTSPASGLRFGATMLWRSLAQITQADLYEPRAS